MSKPTKGFELCGPEGTKHDSCGYGMTFANGWTISVQWGVINYCANRNRTRNPISPSAEIAIFDPKSNYHRPDSWSNTNVQGYLSSDEVLKWMQYTASQPSS
jgi:hypothetical protein